MRYQVFVYGTLLIPDIMREVTGRQYAGVAAVLRGYRRYRMRNRSYPGVVAEAGAEVHGMLFEAGPVALAALDRYEGSCYERRILTVEVKDETRQAHVYVIPDSCRHLIEPVEWDLDYWRRCQRRL
ncbi:MAG: gamma-glutamylcyclotransferase family protein [Gammaproteobacteria bacterium]|nr:gamma-glutamylcyclotransferase family protein [Gammaproteobacteria bacterium]